MVTSIGSGSPDTVGRWANRSGSLRLPKVPFLSLTM